MRVILRFATALILAAMPAISCAGLLDELKNCRELPDDEARLGCYDTAVDNNKARTQDAPPPPPPKPPASADVSQEDLFGKNSAEMERTMERATGSASIDRLEATVTRLQWTTSGKLVITLNNGQVWRQKDSGDLRLSEGDDVIIRKAALGSFLMQKAGSKRSKRVTRSR